MTVAPANDATMPIADPYVANARRLLSQAIEASKGFPEDARLASAQSSMLAALAELIRYQHNIGDGGTP